MARLLPPESVSLESVARDLRISAPTPDLWRADALSRSARERTWTADFVHWYNFEHRHSAIRYVTPAQRHTGADQAILAARHQTYLQARERNPRRWSGNTRDWSHIGVVTLNPERDTVVNAALHAEDILELVA